VVRGDVVRRKTQEEAELLADYFCLDIANSRPSVLHGQSLSSSRCPAFGRGIAVCGENILKSARIGKLSKNGRGGRGV
jgi:hypothetical protein